MTGNDGMRPKSGGKRKRIGDILLDAGLINEEQMKAALQKQSVTGKRLGTVLVEMKFLSEENMVGALSKQLGLRSVDIKKISVSEDILKRFSLGFLMKHQVVPIGQAGHTLKVAMTDPLDRPTISDIEFMIGGAVEPLVASPSAIEQFLKSLESEGDGNGTAEPAATDGIEVLEEKSIEVDAPKLKAASESPAVIRACNKILWDGLKLGATTIHIKPRQSDVLIRYRIDGFLRNASTLTTTACSALLARLKTIGRMKITDCAHPQNGGAAIKAGDREADLRMSTLPTVHGEKMVIRIIGKNQKIRNLENLGMHPKDLSAYQSLLSKLHGIILLAGPVGSGISTTLYTSLRYLRSEELSIVTLEDSIESLIPGINQVHVNRQEGMSYAGALKSVLNQDPDIIMISEIEDSETAQLLFHAALMGYLALSSIYTNNVVSAITHLLHLGIRPHIAASSIAGIAAQRLVRKNCPHCMERYVPEPRVLASLNIEGMEVSKMQFYRGKGCKKCGGTGYAGQIGLFEIMPVDYAIRELILKRASEREIYLTARERGMTTMEENGLYLVLNKITTLEEILRAIPPDEIATRRTGSWEKHVISLYDEALYLL